jgi:leucyl/phenylalanyl-tRNA--protein transferase
VKSILNLPRLGNAPSDPFPPTSAALVSPRGLLAWGGDLHPERLLLAYRQGIFPWYSEGQPILWWSPAPRCVILPGDIHCSRRTRRRYNRGDWRLTCDTAFQDVIEHCAEPRAYESATWITRDMIRAFEQLHEMGHAHSVEVWDDGSLAGGIYGLSMGGIFFGESMFSLRPDASKIALIALCRQLEQWGYGILDCQVGNPHLYSMGATDMPRAAFEHHLRDLTTIARPAGSWSARFTFEPRW